MDILECQMQAYHSAVCHVLLLHMSIQILVEDERHTIVSLLVVGVS
jgi:hypothetical protein